MVASAAGGAGHLGLEFINLTASAGASSSVWLPGRVTAHAVTSHTAAARLSVCSLPLSLSSPPSIKKINK